VKAGRIAALFACASALIAVLDPLARADDSVAEPAIDVYTMGAGDEIFAHYGHAAICVSDQKDPDGRCYNFGTADFSTPIPLTYAFIRGRAMFWVSVIDRRGMIRWYIEEDRSVWVQRLALSREQANELSRSLAASAAGSEKYYRYHHFDDNCTTRIRDMIDLAVGGRLKRETGALHAGPSFRDYAKRGFTGRPLLLIAANLLLGRPADRRTSVWEAMFLPDILRDAITQNLGARPEEIYARRAPLTEGPLWMGDLLLALTGVLLALLSIGARRVGPRLGRAVLSLSGIVLGTIGLLIWSLALASSFVELRYNELACVLVPFDMVLVLLRGTWVERYLRLRLMVIALATALWLAGILVQPLWPSLVLVGAPLGAAFTRHLGRGA
jgi:hypothetical protein